jgi:cytochrome c oxidase cbb3-type subunit 1/cytochrome c oxidase cbb3-type subunit I/II
MTVRGYGGLVLKDPAARFVLAGTIWYLIVCIQGPSQSLPFLQRITHFNNWTVGHAHIAVLGFVGYIAIGTMWHVLPDILHRRIWSRRLINLQFGLLTFGLTVFFIVLTIAGLIQGQAWDNGETVRRVLYELTPYMVLRLLGGVSIIAVSFIGLYNLIMTKRHGEAFDPEPLEKETPP